MAKKKSTRPPKAASPPAGPLAAGASLARLSSEAASAGVSRSIVVDAGPAVRIGSAPSAASKGIAPSTFLGLPFDEQFELAKAVLTAHSDQLRAAHPDIVGIGVGYKRTKHKAELRLALRFGVRSKAAAPQPIPGVYQGITTDVYESRFEQAIAGGDPVAPNANATKRGTIGVAVYDLADATQRPILMTCAHVVGLNPDARVTMLDGLGNVVGSSLPNTASHTNWIRNSGADVALIDPQTGLAVQTGVVGPVTQTSRFGPVNVDSFRPGTQVWMVGQKSSYRVGYLQQWVAHETLDDGSTVADHFTVAGHNGAVFAQRGDSGAVIIQDETIVGILRAVNQSNGVALCFPFWETALRLKIGLL